MGVVHAALAWLAGASIAGLIVVALATAAGRLAGHRLLDRLILVQAGLTGLAALAGLATLATAAPPSDGLHVLYGALAPAAPLGVRAAVQGREPRTIARWVAVAGAVALGATLRTFMTGT